MTSDPAPLAMLAAVALVAAGVMVASIRGETVAERYVTARCEQDMERLDRRSRFVRVALVTAFSNWTPSPAQGAPINRTPEVQRPEDERPGDARDHWRDQDALLMAAATVAGWTP